MYIKAENYRCFDSENPLQIDLNGGITSYVGPNNAGKTAILKFLFEFRELWSKASTYDFINLFGDNPSGLNISYPNVKDSFSLFRTGETEIAC